MRMVADGIHYPITGMCSLGVCPAGGQVRGNLLYIIGDDAGWILGISPQLSPGVEFAVTQHCSPWR